MEIRLLPEGRRVIGQWAGIEGWKSYNQDLNKQRDNEVSKMEENLLLFISHSSKDVDVAEVIIELLRNALNLTENQIRCTSVDGYRLPIGADTNEQLRREIFDTEVFVGLISHDSLDSAFVMFELGARWGSKKYMAPLLCPGIQMSILEGPLTGLNALSCNNVSQLHQFIADIGKELKITPGNPAAYQKCIDEIVNLPSRHQEIKGELLLSSKNKTNALEWIKSINHEDLLKNYWMLLWYLYNNILVANVDMYEYHMMYPDNSFLDTPIFRDLKDNKIIKIKAINTAGKLCIEIDKEVFNYLKSEFTDIPNHLIPKFGNNRFHYLFF